MSSCFQRGRLACALLKQEATVRAQIQKHIVGAHVLQPDSLFGFVAIVFQINSAKEMENGQYEEHIAFGKGPPN